MFGWRISLTVHLQGNYVFCYFYYQFQSSMCSNSSNNIQSITNSTQGGYPLRICIIMNIIITHDFPWITKLVKRFKWLPFSTHVQCLFKSFPLGRRSSVSDQTMLPKVTSEILQLTLLRSLLNTQYLFLVAVPNVTQYR